MLFLAAVILQSKQNNVGWCIALMDCGCEWCVHACVFYVCVTEDVSPFPEIQDPLSRPPQRDQPTPGQE